MQKIKVISNGAPEETEVLIDGKVISGIQHLKYEIGVGQIRGTLTLEMLVMNGDISIDGEIDKEISLEVKQTNKV